MMLIITSVNPYMASEYLIDNTNKNFCFKSLLEIAQLISSCGISSVYREVKQGKMLKEWIKQNISWVYRFYCSLFLWCLKNINLKDKTKKDLLQIENDLFNHLDGNLIPKTAIWRYSKEYESEYPTNSELDIDLVCELYKTYLREFKGFGKKEV